MAQFCGEFAWQLPETPVIVMKGQVAHWSGFQDEVGTETGTLTVGLTMLTGNGGMTMLISDWVIAATEI